jgi:hypothetical protein
MRRLLRPLWVFLALVFLLEAWLWAKLEPVVEAVVRLIAWDRLRDRLRALIEGLPPAATLIVFIIPVVLLFPFKLLGWWLLARGKWIGAAFTLIAAKLVGVGVAAFVFEATKPKLMQMAWFRRFYDWVIAVRDWALRQTEPIRRRMQQLIWLLQPERAGRFFQRLMRLRRRAFRRPA